MVGSLVGFLRNQGYRVRLEVPNLGQSADVVATRNRWVTFVEAKRHDWRRAIEQCRAHQVVADYICIAISLRSVPDALLKQVRGEGYGLIQCDPTSWDCEWVVEPSRNLKVWPPQRRRMAAAMRAISYVD
ncbi:MAG: hypothetical protein PVJ57_06545 [Phycisphaerae bacterium]